MIRLALALVMVLALATTAAAQGPRVEPPGGGVTGPSIGPPAVAFVRARQARAAHWARAREGAC